MGVKEPARLTPSSTGLYHSPAGLSPSFPDRTDAAIPVFRATPEIATSRRRIRVKRCRRAGSSDGNVFDAYPYPGFDPDDECRQEKWINQNMNETSSDTTLPNAA
jgi:hypothetical protein